MQRHLVNSRARYQNLAAEKRKIGRSRASER